MELAWIHLKNLNFFLFLGAHEAEQMIGQNITLHLSLCVPYKNTEDKLERVVDYGDVYKCLATKIMSLKRVCLLEYLAEQLLDEIRAKFPKIHAAKIVIKKDYVPLENFSGTAKISVKRQFTSK